MNSSFTSSEVSAALGTESPVEGHTAYTFVSTDTRTLEPGALFVALRGENFDAHDHLGAARDAGAAAAVVRKDTPRVEGLPFFEVDDPLLALAHLAAAHRARFQGPVIAITGQNGKTSTKEMVAAVMATKWKTHKTRGNLNNLVGVPLTVLEAPEGTEAMVVEAGANMPGEIARFREILKPDIAIVTSAGSGHLEGFGSVAGVLREKLSLTVGVPLAIVGVAPPELEEGARGRANRTLVAGNRDGALWPDEVTLGDDGRHEVSIDGVRFRLAARGLHQVANAMIAWTVVRELGLDKALAAKALEEFKLPGGRGELSEHGPLLLLNDSYNANPESFTALIHMVGKMAGKRRLVFVAGSMRELGDHAPGLHASVARELAELKPDVLALVGEFVPAFAPLRQHYLGRVIDAPDAESLGPLLAAEMSGDEFVVLKGSRGVTLEKVLPFILPRSNG